MEKLIPCYIIHPFRGKNGDYEVNLQQIKKICRKISEEEPDLLPVNPVLMFSFLSDEHDREKGLKYCEALMELIGELKGIAYVCGDYRHSEGSQKEITWAGEYGVALTFKPRWGV